MKLPGKQFFLSIAITVIALQLAAQNKKEDYIIARPEQKVSKNLYKDFRFIDERRDTANLGIVQLGAFNRKAFVQPGQPLDQQFTSLFNQLNDSMATEGELLVVLRQISFAEVTKAMSERGYFHLRAAAFGKAEGGYKLLSTTDTVVVIKGMDVTKPMFRKGSNAINDYIGQNMVKAPTASRVYSLNDIRYLDSVEKRDLPLYNTTAYTEGVYKSFEAFMQQKPEITNATIAYKKHTTEPVVNITDGNGKKQKLRSKDLYALVWEGKPWIATDYGYYPLTKEGDDFFFTGKAAVPASQGDIMAASLFFGVLGGLLASSPTSELFEMKLDHIGGGFIRLRQLPDPAVGTPSN